MDVCKPIRRELLAITGAITGAVTGSAIAASAAPRHKISLPTTIVTPTPIQPRIPLRNGDLINPQYMLDVCVKALRCKINVDTFILPHVPRFDGVDYEPFYNVRHNGMVATVFSDRIHRDYLRISDSDLLMSNEQFIERFIGPAVERLALGLNSPCTKGRPVASFRLALPEYMTWSERAEYRGLSLRMTRGYNIQNNNFDTKIDMLYGFFHAEASSTNSTSNKG